MLKRLVIICLISLLFPFARVHSEPLDVLLDYPFRTERDMISYSHRCKALLARLKLGIPVNGAPNLEGFLVTAAAFTSTRTSPGEEYSIVNFAKSADPALLRLRREVGLPPPPGGAIVRIYLSKDDMPRPVRSLFDDETINGITWSHRFIAVIRGDRSDEQTANAVSHELVHAYVSSKMGAGFDGLPKWFNEGTALYIAGGKALYASDTAEGQRNLSWFTKEYNEYRTVFAYLQARLGTQGVAAFIRDVVEKQSADKPLRSATGIRDYGELRDRALHWETMRQVKFSALIIGILAIFAVMVVRAHRRAVATYDLRLAVRQGNLEDAEDALRRGANVNGRDSRGHTPLDLARENEEMIGLLRDHGGVPGRIRRLPQVPRRF